MYAILRVLIICTGAWGGISSAFAFTDPLDQPAIMSDRASSAPLYGLAGDGLKHIVAVGPRGHIVHSEDAGQHFTQSHVPLSSDLVAVYFPTQQKGWAVGHDGVILHSADGGKNWVRQLDGREIGERALNYYSAMTGDNEQLERAREYSQALKADGPIRPLLDIYFENESVGWAIGAFNLVLHTSDGGKNWTPWMERTENSNEYSLHAIRKVGEHIYIAGELGLLLRLDREQQRFVQLESPYSGSFFGLTGRKGLVVAFGLRGNAFTSRDDGQTWSKLETQTSNSINAGTMLADGSFMLASAGGELLLSNADGDKIIKRIPGNRTPVYGLTHSSAGIAAVGPKGVQILTQQK